MVRKDARTFAVWFSAAYIDLISATAEEWGWSKTDVCERWIRKGMEADLSPDVLEQLDKDAVPDSPYRRRPDAD